MDWTIGLWRLGAALLAGGLVGFEREVSGKPAGFRTNILITVGAALATHVSLEISTDVSVTQRILSDPTRVAAGIVTGIGFLGAGSIIQQRASVRGLTTAATIWVLAAIGIAMGAGYFALGAVTTAITIVTLWLLDKLERLFEVPDETVEYELVIATATNPLDRVRKLAEELDMSVFGLQVRKDAGRTILRFNAKGTHEAQDRLSDRLDELEAGAAAGSISPERPPSGGR